MYSFFLVDNCYFEVIRKWSFNLYIIIYWLYIVVFILVNWNIIVINKIVSSIRVSWSSLDSFFNGGIWFYFVFVRKINSSSELVSEIVVGNVIVLEIKDFEGLREYKVVVVVVNVYGILF